MRDPITIITTVRDGDAHLGRYFSNLRQILRPRDQVVIVDDASTTPLAKPTNWQHDPRLIILCPGKIGRGAALNLAIENSSTDLIAIQDIDDISLASRLDRQVDVLCNDHNQLVFTRAISDPWRPTLAALQHFSPARLYFSNPLHHSSLAMHRSVWAHAGGYTTDLPCCIDLDFYLRACCVAKARINRLSMPLIERTLDPGTRHFARIPDALYQKTRASVLARYRPDLPWSIWLAAAKLRELQLFSARDVR
ncbi:MAG: glycosyltransferase family 2 protein [Thalassospira sp.]|uniref:glycosyltransferase family 2 protein n=1 Tax=Thalassospira sp. TaxID=1912094 RepID=UPI001B090316|nr:glycosyltransferase family 2 protein [Thalassospira sp.]MBO6579478.1 glycosyltransferase family 2 protein [Thalassospira sp.]MBO6802506.1 glycosyltransferase family 2 protein [Thalassospira sp.]MBO6819815.1 glycosyltransferase family 2 protein [Thalassospira sp.]MBO6886488.1 glycosyltransferase family 2 protein [Thalassospira sp.]